MPKLTSPTKCWLVRRVRMVSWTWQRPPTAKPARTSDSVRFAPDSSGRERRKSEAVNQTEFNPSSAMALDAETRAEGSADGAVGVATDDYLPRKSATRKAEALLVRMLTLLGDGFLAALRKILWPGKRPQSADRVCVYRIGNVGDAVCALPAIHAVRQAYPQAHLTLVTSPGRRDLPSAFDLLNGADWLDEIYIYYAEDVAGIMARLRLVRELRSRMFDVWFEIPQDVGFITALRNMVVARAAGPRWGYGWRVCTVRFARQAQSESAEAPNEVERLAAIVKAAGLAVSPSFPLPLNGEHRRRVDEVLSAGGLDGRPLVAIAPGAKRPTNRWPAERFAEVARHLAQRGYSIAVLGGASDHEVCNQIAEAGNSRTLSLAGRTSLLESCEVLRRCQLLICNDSGVQHLAAAVGVPCVSLFSFREIRGKWRPYGSRHVVLQKWVECHSCLLEVCPYDNRCIKKIQVSGVLSSADRLLGPATD